MQAVSFIILNYRGSTQTAALVRQLREQCKASDEIIIVDNASGEAEAAELQALAGDRVKFLFREANDGFSGGMNAGARTAVNELLCFLCQDTVLSPTFRDRIAARDLAHELVTPRVLNHSTKAVWWAGGFLWDGNGIPRLRIGGNIREDQQGKSAYATGFSLIIPTHLFRDVDGFDERFFMYYEDADLSLRCRKKGAGITYRPDILVYHDEDPTSHLPRPTKIWAYLRSAARFLRRHYGTAACVTWVVLLPWLLAKEWHSKKVMVRA